MGRLLHFASVLVIGSLAFVVTPSAVAAPLPPGSVGVFPTWSVSGASGAYTGTAAFPVSAGFPATTVTSNSTTVRAPAGESAYLGASAGFGQNFGSTRSQPYLYFSQAAGNAASTTTITFDGAPPVGWGFALGDIDADWVQIVALDSAGAPLPASVLGAQDTDNDPRLNYCNNVPRPSACVTGPFTDVPAWLETGGVYNGATYPAGSVVGSGSDTSGSYDWFLPTSDVRQLQLTFTRIPSGFPVYQFWLAAPAPAAAITGSISGPDGATVPSGTSLVLESADGTPVLDLEDQPVMIPLESDGTFAFETEQGQYLLEVVVPPGFVPITPIAVDASAAAVALAPIIVAAVPDVVADPPAPELAATGAGDANPVLLDGGLGALLLGIALLMRAGRSSPSRHRVSAGRGR